MKTIYSTIIFLDDISSYSTTTLPKDSEIIDVEYDSPSYLRFYYLTEGDYNDTRIFNFAFLKENIPSNIDVENYTFLKTVEIKELNLEILINNNENNSKINQDVVERFFIFYEKVLTENEKTHLKRKRVLDNILVK
tara:strand:- start:420 stop:827 length:408 start_codon:yes stop_codon:yes gene_type:complete